MREAPSLELVSGADDPQARGAARKVRESPVSKRALREFFDPFALERCPGFHGHVDFRVDPKSPCCKIG